MGWRLNTSELLKKLEACHTVHCVVCRETHSSLNVEQWVSQDDCQHYVVSECCCHHQCGILTGIFTVHIRSMLQQ